MADTEEESNGLVARPEFMLTTTDNPFDPWTQFDEWLMWDLNAGYHTPSLLARVALISDELSDADEALAIQQAIDTIVGENVSGVHIQVAEGEIVPQ